MGRLQIRKSGRCQLILGSQIMDVEVGTKVGFLQVSIQVLLVDGNVSRDRFSVNLPQCVISSSPNLENRCLLLYLGIPASLTFLPFPVYWIS